MAALVVAVLAGCTTRLRPAPRLRPCQTLTHRRFPAFSGLKRLRRLQDAGVVRGVHADIDPAQVGYGVRAVVGINVPQPGKKALIDKLRQSPQVLECHHVSGNDSYVMQVVARDLPDLEHFLGEINGYGETRTSIVFSTPIPRRGLARPA